MAICGRGGRVVLVVGCILVLAFGCVGCMRSTGWCGVVRGSTVGGSAGDAFDAGGISGGGP
eukprot:288651-Prymnesium_polylepis.1